MAALRSKESLCFCPEEVKGRETSGNVNICSETEPRLRHPRLPLSLIKHFLVFLYKMKSKPAPPSQCPISGLVEQMEVFGAPAFGAQIGEDRSHPSRFWLLGVWGAQELKLPEWRREMYLSSLGFR